MKRCPECRRDYYDDSLIYCLDDGSALLEGPGSGDARLAEEPATAVFRSAAPSSEAATRAQIPTTYDLAEKVNSAGRGKLFIALAALVIVLAAGGFLAYRS